jgi:hypothetical protein
LASIRNFAIDPHHQIKKWPSVAARLDFHARIRAR